MIPNFQFVKVKPNRRFPVQVSWENLRIALFVVLGVVALLSMVLLYSPYARSVNTCQVLTLR